uniref:GIY-YIG endonuclease n=1 Tax=Inonotus hispidus TaxID=40469 RepID=UPI002181FB6A|nr:GIY-YIG endonuclease [Inonotus hispidus]UVF38000.1 GIY-YIG endonuclease [Inonotus hispidus]
MTNQTIGKTLKSLENFLKTNFIFTRSLYRGLPKLTITPAVTYKNAKINKSLIFKDNKDKAFVYRWINKLNGKEYLGSTSSAKRRLNTYYDLKTLGEVNMPIYNAILKHGHENFIFEIIEYCLPEDTIKREQYYLDNFDFEYNVLANANSLAGYKHTAETLAKFKGRQNLLGYKHTPETLEMLRAVNTAKVHTKEAKEVMRNSWAQRKLKSDLLELGLLNEIIPSKSKKGGKIVVVTNIETNVSTEYKSISEAATVLSLTRVTLRKYIKNKEIFIMLKENNSGLVKEKYLITLKDKT